MSIILEIRDLKVNYGVHEAVHGVNMDIAEGKITAIIGSNGAGKTTIINALSGAVKREGSIRYKGQPLTPRVHQVVRRGIVQVPEGRRIFPGLTVEENLMLGAFTVRDRQLIGKLLDDQYRIFPRLGERKSQDAGTLSGGEQQMLAISRALMSQPKVLMLDEPSWAWPRLLSRMFLHRSDVSGMRGQPSSWLNKMPINPFPSVTTVMSSRMDARSLKARARNF